MKHWHQAVISYLIPLEWVAITTAIAALLLIAIFDVSPLFPGLDSAVFAVQHYIVGAAFSLGVSLALTRSDQSRSLQNVMIDAVRGVIAFTLIVYLHFNFKLWAQLINPMLFDSIYQKIDELLWPLVLLAKLISIGFEPIKQAMPNAYHDVFVYLFFSSFILFSFHPRARKHCGEQITCIALILSLGGLSYAIAPAWGPFIYAPSPNDVTETIQTQMASFQEAFIQTNGASYTGQYFVAALAAMPSLHSAHTVALWIYARRHLPWLGYAYLPAVAFILTEAIASRWHYFIDLIAGIAIALLCDKISRKLHNSAPRYTKLQHNLSCIKTHQFP